MVRQIPLGSRKYPGHFALVDDEDAERVLARHWTAQSIHGRWFATTSNGYRTLPDGRKRQDRIYLHRFVLNVTGKRHVAILNGDALDCRKSNLESATRTALAQRHPASSRRFVGVYETSFGTFRASIGKGGRITRLGTYRTREEAARAYDRAALDLYGSSARTNFPDAGPTPRRLGRGESRVGARRGAYLPEGYSSGLPRERPARIKPEDWSILQRRLGGETLAEIGNSLGRSRERIRQREQEALALLTKEAA